MFFSWQQLHGGGGGAVQDFWRDAVCNSSGEENKKIGQIQMCAKALTKKNANVCNNSGEENKNNKSTVLVSLSKNQKSLA